ncbi:hypothetical protein E2C01_054157 [Portunus trituberculatus]|uniref:Uncharacterized protein n=1 Tax=Portunus trituberculatus TaxID=210409 RepID=A0A5B7GII9_PORTR|nr:hypothetical protein [Portunus trituberculatus]
MMRIPCMARRNNQEVLQMAGMASELMTVVRRQIVVSGACSTRRWCGESLPLGNVRREESTGLST